MEHICGGRVTDEKYGFAYFVLFLLLVVIQVTKGIRITVSEYQSYMDYSLTFNGRSRMTSLLVYNIAIMAICLIVAIALTLNKKNKMKFKWFILVIMLSYCTFLPIVMVESTSRFDPQDVEIYYKTFMTLFLVSLNIPMPL